MRKEEEVEVEQVLPEELEAMLDEPREAPLLRGRGAWIGGLLSRINQLIDRILSGESKGLRDAAINGKLVSRRFGARLWRSAARDNALRQKDLLDKPEDFASLLQPLSSAEVLLLQQEIEADATVFSRIEVLREEELLENRKGILAGMLVGIFFLLLAGPGYLTETLYGSGLPSWIPLGSEVREWFSAVSFALGVLLPFLAIFEVAEAVQMMLQKKREGEEGFHLSWGLPLVLALVSLVSLLLGGIIPALLLLIFSHLLSSAERGRRDEDDRG